MNADLKLINDIIKKENLPDMWELMEIWFKSWKSWEGNQNKETESLTSESFDDLDTEDEVWDHRLYSKLEESRLLDGV